MKNKEIQALSEQDIQSKVAEEKAAMIKMKVNHGVSPLENPILLRINRRNIARLLTEATKRKATKK
ncbi:MAG: 50S ribosomal protein L29 [Bacteroidia bacterium]|jgi:large subunit ribosomal protein L29|nr:50S ribosomal protein L29 [Sphingobacteriaceae bacterium]MBK7817133.1 50S ribosomal protein L29 [Sphingobacteriaceae bacterium]MBP9069736.1 50S ribosomal protein L29 [Bacteroidia bacterium]